MQRIRAKASRERNDAILVAIVPQVNEKGYLDHVLDMPRALGEFTKLLDKTSNETVKIGRNLGSQAKKITKARGKPTRIHKIATATARDVDKYSERLANINLQMERVYQSYETSWLGLIDWWNDNTPGWQTEFGPVFSQFEVFIPAIKGAIKGTFSFRASAADLMGQNLIGDLTVALRRLLNQLDRHIDILQNLQQVSEQVYVEHESIGSCC